MGDIVITLLSLLSGMLQATGKLPIYRGGGPIRKIRSWRLMDPNGFVLNALGSFLGDMTNNLADALTY